MGTKAACQDPPSNSARGREADQKFLSGLYKVQALPERGGGALSHKDSVISQGPEPMARLKGRVRDYKRKGQAGLAWNFDVVLFTIQIPQRLCVPVPEGQRRSRLFGMQSATPLSPGALY